MPLNLLVTGFSVFPGAPVNPSEALIGWLGERRPSFGPQVRLHTGLLETAFGSIREQLGALGRQAKPDVAVLFGLARSAKGFRIERTARNRISTELPDVHGYCSPSPRVGEGPVELSSGLPVEAIAARLSQLGLPHEFSDDAGAYLCNTAFYLSRCGAVEDFHPAQAGFVHIPYLAAQFGTPGVEAGEGGIALSEDDLWQGALAVIETCVADALARR